MTFIQRILGSGATEETPEVPEVPQEQEQIADEMPVKNSKPVRGIIIKVELSKGWGFISSKEIPYTRIFFHWSGLLQNTLRFPDLKKGMKVEFLTMEHPERGIRAIRIRVIEDEA